MNYPEELTKRFLFIKMNSLNQNSEVFDYASLKEEDRKLVNIMFDCDAKQGHFGDFHLIRRELKNERH